jgi:cysteine-rich repeat protein
MKRLCLISVAFLIACGSSHTPDEDAGITFDAHLPDAGPPIVCGNGVLETGEMCDDGNATPGDGCTATCTREAHCGDGDMGGTEVCDDGNNRSGDGCRSDCMSNETCGNGIIDFARGEICDGTANCVMTGGAAIECRRVTGCGDGVESGTEQCDQLECAAGSACTDMGCLVTGCMVGPACPPELPMCRADFCTASTVTMDPVLNPSACSVSFDGCDAACRDEIAMVVNSLRLANDRTGGCDLTGDGDPDNAFGRALGILAGEGLSFFLNQQIMMGNLILLLDFLGLDDVSGTNDSDFRIAWLLGQDVDGDATDNFSGMEPFAVNPSSLPGGAPATSIQSRVTASSLFGGPEDIPLPFGFFDVRLEQGQVEGTTVASAGQLSQITEGQLCGGIPVNLLALLSGLAGGMLTFGAPCDGGAPANLLDVLIAGGTVNGNFGGFPIMIMVSATRPDLDLDEDGLEGFEILASGPAGCQPVVSACIDGNGTRIDGRGCYSNPAIADGYSAAFDFTAIRAQLQPAP